MLLCLKEVSVLSSSSKACILLGRLPCLLSRKKLVIRAELRIKSEVLSYYTTRRLLFVSSVLVTTLPLLLTYLVFDLFKTSLFSNSSSGFLNVLED